MNVKQRDQAEMTCGKEAEADQASPTAPTQPDSEGGQQTQSDGFDWWFWFMILMVGWMIWLMLKDTYENNTVESETDLGVVLGMGKVTSKDDVASSNLIGREVWIVETAKGYYPLKKAAAIEKGASVVLVTTLSGRRHICSKDKSYCVETSKKDQEIRKEVGN